MAHTLTISKRIGVCVLIMIGAICLIAFLIWNHQDSYWNAAYETEFSNSRYWTFYEDGTLEQSTRGDYSFIEKDGELLIQLLPEGEEPNIYSYSYVVKIDGSQLQLIPYSFYFEYESIKESAELYGEKMISVEEAMLTYNLIEGTPIDNTATNVGAIYQLTKDGKEVSYTCHFNLDGTYQETLTQKYKVNSKKGLLKIEKTNFSYSENDFTGELHIYLEDEVFATLTQIPDCGMPE